MINLTITEQVFLEKQLKNKKFYLYFCLLDIIAAISMLIYIIFQDSFASSRFVLMILLLINARMGLQKYRDVFATL